MQDILEVFDAVGRRIGIGHGRHSADASGRSRPGAGGNGLLVFETRFAQMHVDIDKARGQYETLKVQDGNAIPGRQLLPYLGYFSRLDEYIHGVVQPIGRVDQTALADQEVIVIDWQDLIVSGYCLVSWKVLRKAVTSSSVIRSVGTTPPPAARACIS